MSTLLKGQRIGDNCDKCSSNIQYIRNNKCVRCEKRRIRAERDLLECKNKSDSVEPRRKNIDVIKVSALSTHQRHVVEDHVAKKELERVEKEKRG